MKQKAIPSVSIHLISKSFISHSIYPIGILKIMNIFQHWSIPNIQTLTKNWWKGKKKKIENKYK